MGSTRIDASHQPARTRDCGGAFADCQRAGETCESPLTDLSLGFMVGAASMGPQPLDLDGRRDEVMARFEEIGKRIMARTGAGGCRSAQPSGPVGRLLVRVAGIDEESDGYKRCR